MLAPQPFTGSSIKLMRFWKKETLKLKQIPAELLVLKVTFVTSFITFFMRNMLDSNGPKNGLDLFLNFFIKFTHMDADFAYYNIFKTVSAVNLIRYKQGHFVNISNIHVNFDEIIPDLTVYQETFSYFEETNQVKVDNMLIQQ